MSGPLPTLRLSRELFELLAVARLAVFLLAFVVAFQAFRGYRRNDSHPMLYLAVGFVLLGAEPFVRIVLARIVGAGMRLQYATLAESTVVVGAAFVLVYHSLRLVEEGSA
ncbi:MAG: hypothetical protein ABEH66_06025 [Halobacteriales archaeon]